MTHEDLRKRAVRWLTNSKHCAVVLSELVSAAGEIPDAIGWNAGRSILVECKVSRADFFRNKDKACIRGDRGLGRRRYFMVPEKLVTKEDMDQFPGYGLLYVSDNSVWVIRDSETTFLTSEQGEICMLVSALRRVRTREFLTINIVEELGSQETAVAQ